MSKVPPQLSDQQSLNGEANQRSAQLEAVNKISTSLRGAETLDEMLTMLAHETQMVVDATAVTVWLYDAAQDELRQAAATGFPNLTIRLKPGEGITGQVFINGVPHISHEFKTDPRTIESARAQVPAGLAGAAIPIRTATETVGVLFVSVLLPRELSNGDVQLLATIAEIAGIAIHRIRLDALTERRLQRLSALQTINLAITTSLDLQVTLNIVLDQVLTQLQADAADILLLNPETQSLDYITGRGFRSKDVKRSLQFGEGAGGRAAIERHVVILANLDDSNRNTDFPQFTDDHFVSCIAAPLLARGQLKGVLEIFRCSAFDPDQEWLNFLQTLAESATIAINNAAQFQNAGSANAEFDAAFDMTIESWARALDKREQEPDGHVLRVADMSVKLARAMGLKESDLVHVRRGALLHDLGKVSVPETILLKPGPLSEKEWTIMRHHTIYAYELLSPIAYLKPALAIPYCHHERWDGTGYPNGLSGEAIPLEARIFAAVDIWDALGSERAYRPAWPEAKVIARIRALSGTHLDPQVAQIFCQLLTEGK